MHEFLLNRPNYVKFDVKLNYHIEEGGVNRKVGVGGGVVGGGVGLMSHVQVSQTQRNLMVNGLK